MNQTIVNSMKRLYSAGRITKDDIIERVKNGKLTTDDYTFITGEDYAQ